MDTILGIIIVGAAAICTASCLIGTITCLASAQRKYFPQDSHKKGCKAVMFSPDESSPIVEDPTYATDYETGKLVLIQDDVYSSDDDYDGGLNLK